MMNRRVIISVIFVLLLALALINKKAQANDIPLYLVDERAGVSFALSYHEIIKYGQSSINTSTPWTDGISHFNGVPLKALLADVVPKFKKIIVKAHNDYKATISRADLDENDVILAWSIDGKKLSLRDKGPYWIVFDLDALGVKGSQYLNKMVWQVRSIHFVE